jgi:ABC-2 type transport system ATP-binding protein
MRQRLGIAACLVRRPRLMLLDEPANGVDPAGVHYLRRLLRRLGSEGTTIFLASHLPAEVQEVCTRVAIILVGRIVYEGGLGELLERADRRYELLVRVAGPLPNPVAGDAIVRSLWVSGAFALPPLIAAWTIFNRRDVTS